jgi:hypothetical protein
MKFLYLLCLAGAFASTLNADTIIYNNIGESSAGADGVDFAGRPLHYSLTSVTARQETDLQPILSGVDTSSDAVDVGVYADNSTTSGELMAVFGDVDDSLLSDTPDVYDITLTAFPLLTDGTLYWFGLSGTTSVEWYYNYDMNGIGIAEKLFANQTGAYSNYYDPYQISVKEGVSVTPEPSGTLLVTAGLGVLALLPRRAALRLNRRRTSATYQLARPDRT